VKREWRQLREVPFISIGLVSINVIIYMLDALMNEHLLLAGNLNVFDVLAGREYGRVLWAMFLHADLNHLFNNMIILLFMGNVLEKAVGHCSFAVIYLMSGICGNICSLIYKLATDRMSLSIGASGAVFGMDGLLLALVLFAGRRISSITPGRVLFMVVLSLYNGFASKNIDNAAHVGGLLAGFLLGCLFCIVQHVKYNLKKRGITDNER